MSKNISVKKFRILFSFEAVAKHTVNILQISLIFYLIKNLSFNTGNAYRWLAGFGMITYSSPLLAGYITDRFLTPGKSMILGLITMLIGSLIALFGELKLSLAGIILIGCGSGFFKPNILTLLDKVFNKNDQRRSLYFGRFYLASSVGEIFAVIIGGVLAEYFIIYNPFYLSTLSILTAIILFLVNKRTLFGNHSEKKKQKNNYFVLNLLFFPFSLFFVVYHNLNELILLMALTGLFLTIKGYNKDKNPKLKQSSLKILLIIAYGAIFFSLTVQCYFSLNLVIENFVDRRLTNNFSIPTFWFLLVNPIFGLAIGNYISNYYKKYNLLKRMTYGLITLSLGYFVLFFSTRVSIEKINVLWIFVSYMIFVIADFTIIPQLISELIYTVSINYKSRGVGIWYLTMALAQYLASYIAEFIHSDLLLIGPKSISSPLFLIFLGSIIIAVLIKYNNKKLSQIIIK